MTDGDRTGGGGVGSVGKRIAHYELLEVLGEGGMGTVFRARDLSLSREVAIKRPLPADASDPDRHRRFVRESRAMAGLTHPNIVQVYDVFEEDGIPWIVMELVPGDSLRARLSSPSALPYEEILRISEQLASALGAAHARHVLHRDIKPGNVLLGADGRARLSDFGLARYFTAAEDGSSTSTKSPDISAPGTVAGTSGYMSPEQALGKELDARSDIFGLGTVLYEMCTGRRAFEGASKAQILDSVLNHEPLAIGRLNYEIPVEFERIVRKCLAKNREDRYPDTKDLLVDIRWLRKTSEPTGVSKVTPHPVRRKWRPYAVAAVCALAAVVAGKVVYDRLTPPGPLHAISRDARAWYDRGMHYMEEHEDEDEVVEAIRLFDRTVSRQPEFAEAHAALGNAWWERYRLSHLRDETARQEAERSVEEALRINPDLPLAHNARGYGLFVEGKLDDAREEFLKALASDPNLATAWSNLGQTCAALGRYDEGLRAFREAIRLRPDQFRYRIRLGTFFDHFGEYKSAQEAYRKAIDLNPNSWMAWNNLGASQMRGGKFGEALPNLLRSGEIKDMADVHSNLGTAYYYLGKLPEALQHYRRAVELDPDRALYWANLGDALRESGKDAEARDAYARAVPLARAVAIRESAGPMSHARLGLYCARAGKSECALAEAARLKGLEGASADVYMNAAVIYCITGQTDEAFKVLERAARLGITRTRIEKDPDLSGLAGDPRFKRILQLAG